MFFLNLNLNVFLFLFFFINRIITSYTYICTINNFVEWNSGEYNGVGRYSAVPPKFKSTPKYYFILYRLYTRRVATFFLRGLIICYTEEALGSSRVKYAETFIEIKIFF